MKKLALLTVAFTILVFTGCQSTQLALECQLDPPEKDPISQTDSASPSDDAVFSEECTEFPNTEPVYQTDSEKDEEQDPLKPVGLEQPQTSITDERATSSNDVLDSATPTGGGVMSPTDAPNPTEPRSPMVQQPTNSPEASEPPATEPPESTAPPLQPEPTDPAVTEITYAFKRQVAAFAVQYINQYRSSPCSVLSGMTQVAQYRASQLTYNYGHSASDKRAALAHYEYGRFIDATEFGDDASNSYWEADSAEAICAGFYGTDPEVMGKQIADLIRNSSGHWSYISNAEYKYIGIGVEYLEGSEYGWYCCVMVGSVDYG